MIRTRDSHVVISTAVNLTRSCSVHFSLSEYLDSEEVVSNLQLHGIHTKAVCLDANHFEASIQATLGLFLMETFPTSNSDGTPT